ncbi:MAG: pepsin/retropepsin-like aspartic protease family protein [Candidatus Neomarinimicrobiota bacterium]
MKRFSGSILIVLALIISASRAEQQNTQQNIQKTLNRLVSALNQHDFDALAPYLSADFSFNGYDGKMGRTIMRQIVAQYPNTIESIMIQKFEEKGQQFIVSAEFVFQSERDIKELILSSDYKIVQAPIVQIQLASYPSKQNSKHSITPSLNEVIPAKIVAPFRLLGRLISVAAEIEGVRGNFMIDSGTSDFVLNAKRFHQLAEQAQPADRTPHGAGGAIRDAKWVEASGFKWQNAELSLVKAQILDLTHLEENIKTEIVGIIGANFLQNFTIEFDFSHKTLTLFSENPMDSWQTAPNQVIDFTMVNHIPVIDAQIGNYFLRLGIDCGAEEAMLFSKWEEPLNTHYEFLKNDTLKGADTNLQLVKTVRLDMFKIGKIQYENHSFVIGDLKWGHESIIDGLLGYEFLSQFRTAIDFQNRKLYVWEPVNDSAN